jgi:hypothetical protein
MTPLNNPKELARRERCYITFWRQLGLTNNILTMLCKGVFDKLSFATAGVSTSPDVEMNHHQGGLLWLA